jgi:hypothetical protein
MRSIVAVFGLTVFLAPNSAFALDAAPGVSPAGDEWQLTTTVYGNEPHQRMNLRIEKGKASGWIFTGGKRVSLPAQWLQQDYERTGKETAILLGAVIEYQISEVADRNVGVVAKIRKKYLSGAEGGPK